MPDIMSRLEERILPFIGPQDNSAKFVTYPILWARITKSGNVVPPSLFAAGIAATSKSVFLKLISPKKRGQTVSKSIICLRFLLSIGVAVLAVLPGITFVGSEKVDVCHLSPANLANFHTITIGGKAVPAHLDHND